MTCVDDNFCKGSCYQQCRTLVCLKSHGYGKSDCRIPVGQIDCLQVVDYTGISCSQPSSFEIDDGILHVRNKCQASFKICIGIDKNRQGFPAVPKPLLPLESSEQVTRTSQTQNPVEQKTVHGKNNNNTITENPVPGVNNGGKLHSEIGADMKETDVMVTDLAIGIGIGVFLAVLAVIAYILWRYFYSKKQKSKKNITLQTVQPSLQQRGNPLYDVDLPNGRISTLSHQYEEVKTPPHDILSMSSGATYDSIPLDRDSYRTNNEREVQYSNFNCDSPNSVETILCSTKQGSDSNQHNRRRRSSASASLSRNSDLPQYFVLDPNCREQDPNDGNISKGMSRSLPELSEHTYFVLEKE